MKILTLIIVGSLVVLLGGCLFSLPEEPYPYSFTDANKTLYPRSVEGAHRYISDVREPRWTYVEDIAGQRVKSPTESYRTLTGDCDDYAVMNGSYLQEYFRYDTFLLMIRLYDETLQTSTIVTHMVAFTDFPVDQVSTAPVLEYEGRVYHPIEWSYDVSWRWSTDGVLDQHMEALPLGWSWYEEPELGGWYSGEAYAVEWYQVINLALGVEKKEWETRSVVLYNQPE